MEKSKNLNFLAGELSLLDSNIRNLKNIRKLPFTDLRIYNGSDKEYEIKISNDLKEPLHVFLMDYYEERKEKIYILMRKELNDG